jgi:hypothetical protein
MADIYLSHNPWDRARIAPILALLEREGWSVWRDTRADSGEDGDDARDDAAAGGAGAAACVIAAWSISAIDSSTVRGEAQAAFERGILVPVLIEQVTPPHLFSQIPTTDLTGWNGDATAPEARALVDAVRRTAGVPGLWAAARSARGAPEIDRWESIAASRDPADFANFLSQYPKGPLSDPARARFEQLQLYDEAPTRPAQRSGTAGLWLLAAVLLAIAGAGTWYSLDPSIAIPGLEIQGASQSPPPPAVGEPEAPPLTAEPAVPPFAAEPEAPPGQTAAPQAEVAPSAEPPAPPAESGDVYAPFGGKTKGCPTEEFVCRRTPGCVWWAAFNICVLQEPGADGQIPQEQTVAPPASPVPHCPADEATCRMTAECEWVDHFKSCLPRPPPATTEAPAEAHPDVPQCSNFGDQVSCAEAACEWIVDQCFEKPLAPE